MDEFPKVPRHSRSLLDDHTAYFRSHLELLPRQERRVYVALAGLWERTTTKEMADRARLKTSKYSAQLARLIERGSVQVATLRDASGLT